MARLAREKPAAALVLARLGAQAAVGPALEVSGLGDDVLEDEGGRHVCGPEVAEGRVDGGFLMLQENVSLHLVEHRNACFHAQIYMNIYRPDQRYILICLRS